MQPQCNGLLQKPSLDLADAFVRMTRMNQDVVRDRINDDAFIEFFFMVSLQLAPPADGGRLKLALQKENAVFFVRTAQKSQKSAILELLFWQLLCVVLLLKTIGPSSLPVVLAHADEILAS